MVTISQAQIWQMMLMFCLVGCQIIKLSNGQLPSNIDDLWRLRTQGKVTMGMELEH